MSCVSHMLVLLTMGLPDNSPAGLISIINIFFITSEVKTINKSKTLSPNNISHFYCVNAPSDITQRFGVGGSGTKHTGCSDTDSQVLFCAGPASQPKPASPSEFPRLSLQPVPRQQSAGPLLVMIIGFFHLMTVFQLTFSW